MLILTRTHERIMAAERRASDALRDHWLSAVRDLKDRIDLLTAERDELARQIAKIHPPVSTGDTYSLPQLSHIEELRADMRRLDGNIALVRDARPIRMAERSIKRRELARLTAQRDELAAAIGRASVEDRLVFAVPASPAET